MQLIYNHVGGSVYWLHSVPLVFCACEISNQSTSKKPHHALDLNKLTSCCINHTAVLRYRGLTCETRPMWHDHSFSQSNKATKRARGCRAKFLKRGVRQNMKFLHKIGTLYVMKIHNSIIIRIWSWNWMNMLWTYMTYIIDVNLYNLYC